ncbi:hypothetical protein CEW89_15190 [Celeribacter ethanolicus]|uniref:Lipoprotein with Yx(FWY)xxD motif n=1 Tax=Celeribacter ethanolicus TaxID=1758178 RepID=A0A291GFG2_9RHOB|nr:hypothetical protein [Celeribacter ethanolicus]ATG48792.1 hypothetical protein CEW89_15190 [Celeribacter ethanolicus]
MLKTLPLAAALAAFATTAIAADAPVVTGKLGEATYLMDASTHMTLYTFDKDEKGVSNCYDMCAANWPPVVGDADMELPSGYSLITRKEGYEQVAYKGMPLYGWVKDEKPGDMTGEGVNGVWHVARP